MEKELNQFMELLQKEWGDDFISAVLFGSHAAGKISPLSDIDLLLVYRIPPKSRFARHATVFKLSQKISDTFAEKLSAVILSPAEAAIVKPYYLDMTLYCKILRDRCNFFGNILLQLKKRLQALGSKRVFDPDGNPYWILKENARPGEEITL